MKKIFYNFLKIGLSIALLVTLFLIIGPKEIYYNLIKINPFYIPILILISYVILVLGSINMGILIKPLNKNIKFTKLLKYYILTWSIALVVPGRLGEFSLAYFLKKEQIEMGESFAILILDKLMTIGLYFIISLFGLMIFFNWEETFKIIIPFILLIACISFFIFHYKGRYFITKYILRKYSSKFKGFSKTLYWYFKNHKKELFINFIITFLKLIITTYMIYLIFLSFNQHVQFVSLLVILAILTILSLIPITFSGIGLKEVTGVALLYILGVNPALAVSVFTVNLIITFFVVLLNVLVIKQKVY